MKIYAFLVVLTLLVSNGKRGRGREKVRRDENLCLLTEMIHEKMREIFEIPNEDETRLWQRYMTNSHELLTNENQTVSDAGIYGGQVHV